MNKLIDAEIERQSSDEITNERVKKMIELYEKKVKSCDSRIKDVCEKHIKSAYKESAIKWIKNDTENAMLIIDALRAYNPVVADNATSETCEWCGSDLQILAQAMAIDGAMKFATKQSNYCPNCGRHL